MDLGITLPHYDYSFDSSKPISAKTTLDSAQIVQDAGFDTLYVSDHLGLDLGKYGGDLDPQTNTYPKYQSLEPMTLASAIATTTSKIKIGTLVLCEALRYPALTWAMAKTIFEISGRRFLLGLGAGWYEPDYEAIGQVMPPIGERMTSLTSAAKYFKDNQDESSTKVPIFLGGKGDRLLSIVARYCDGWNTCWAYEFDDYKNRIDSLKRSCEKYDRDPQSIHLSLGLYCVVADTQKEIEDYFKLICELSPPGVAKGKTLESWKPGRLVGTTQEVAEQISRWSDLGVNEIIVNPGFAPFHVGSNEVIVHLSDCLKRSMQIAGVK